MDCVQLIPAMNVSLQTETTTSQGSRLLSTKLVTKHLINLWGEGKLPWGGGPAAGGWVSQQAKRSGGISDKKRSLVKGLWRANMVLGEQKGSACLSLRKQWSWALTQEDLSWTGWGGRRRILLFPLRIWGPSRVSPGAGGEWGMYVHITCGPIFWLPLEQQERSSDPGTVHSSPGLALTCFFTEPLS